MQESVSWNIGIGLFWVGVLALAWGSGCKHMPLMDTDPIEPMDTTMVVDTTVMGEPCEPDVVYFERDILPILIGNCTSAGCHNANDAADGVNLTTYDQVINTADVRPFNLDGSDLYEVITDDDPEDRMPQAPRAPLSSTNINLIATWILQGAEDLECAAPAACDTLSVSYQQDIVPILQTGCLGCHSGGAPSGGVNLSNYNGVRDVATNGKLYGAVARLPGFSPMPQGGPKLPECSIAQIKSWVDAGAQEN